MEAALDAEIRQVTSDMSSYTHEMEQLAQRFTRATYAFASPWIQNKVQETVIAHPEVTNPLGTEGLKPLKADLQRIISGLSETVDTLLGQDKYWEHRTGISGDPKDHDHCYGPHENRDKLDWPIRLILGLAGEVLTQHGFPSIREWQTLLPHEDQLEGTKGIRYVGEYKRSAEMQSILRRYAELHRTMLTLNTQLARAKQAKAEAEAKRLWDQA